MAKRKPAVVAAPIPPSIDRPPLGGDNPRHAVWIEDAEGIRQITASTPGAEELIVGGSVYRHTRETIRGQWIYTRVGA